MTDTASSADLHGVMESPLVMLGIDARRELSVDGRSCVLAEIAFLDIINLRGDAADARFRDAVQAATGLALPQQPNSANVGGSRQLIWLGPDEWLLKDVGAAEDESTDSPLAAALRSALSQHPDLHHSVVKVGSGNTTFTLQGPASADLISRGCPLDLHPRAFASGAVAQSHIARAPVLLRCVEAGASYEITVRRSFAPYLFQWLCAAGD